LDTTDNQFSGQKPSHAFSSEKKDPKNFLEEKLTTYGAQISKELHESAKKRELEEKILEEKKNMSIEQNIQ
jgi:hypothetical protein